MAEADAEQRDAPLEQVAAKLHRVGQTRRITRSVGEHNAMRVMTEHVLDPRVLTHDNDLGTTTAECAQLIAFQAVVDDGDANTLPRVLTTREHDATVQRDVKRFRE